MFGKSASCLWRVAKKYKVNPANPHLFCLVWFCRDYKGKLPKISVHSALRGVVGTEREIECQICQKSFSNRSRERKETCLKPFSNRVSGSERNEGKSPVPIRSVDEAPPGRHSPAIKSKYRPVYQIPLSLHLLPRSYLLGSAFPKPCFCGLRRLIFCRCIFYG